MAGLKILGIHGLGDHRGDPWAAHWADTIRSQFPAGFSLDFQPFSYDDIFERVEVSSLDAAKATASLLGSGIVTGIGSWFGREGTRSFGPAREVSPRGMLDGLDHWMKWYPGYVVGWLKNEEFRPEVRDRLLRAIDDFQPDLILAHSLGSLISYDALTSLPDLVKHPKAKNHLKHVSYVTLGSQLGNPFVVRNLTPGRIVKPATLRWWHLYNPNDRVFTAPIRLPGTPGFEQVVTQFDIDGFADHKAEEYLGHSATKTSLWEPLALTSETGAEARTARAAGAARLALQMGAGPELLAESPRALGAGSGAGKGARAGRPPRRRAVLVGIDEYADPSNNLAGCVNDVFKISQTLQERGFHPEEIRVVFNSRATARALRERWEWLVDGAVGGDTLVFFFSGHGAQLPARNAAEAVDSLDETLVPHDFDWSNATAFTDDSIYDLYSQLPYDTRMLLMFDCCHSGGIHRDGGAKARGLTPPDDIRHRAMMWNKKRSMWDDRELTPFNTKFANSESVQSQFFGKLGTVRRLGRAAALRGQAQDEYEKTKASNKSGPVGPYLPLILEACQEQQLAFEYRHGGTSFGAFTYTLVEALRKAPHLSVKKLVRKASEDLKELKYDQVPNLLGPRSVLDQPFPSVVDASTELAAAKDSPPKRTAAKKSSVRKPGR